MAETVFPAAASSLAAVPAHHAALRPGATALRFAGRPITYGELDALARAFAWRAAREWGVRAGDRVAWLGANHPAQLALLFGLARLGAILLPLNFRLAPAEWDGLVRDCTPRVLVHDGEWAAQARDLAQRHGLALHGAEEVLAGGEAMDDDHGAAAAAALLVYTSGTTGGPKAAVHTQGQLLANMRIAAAAQAMTPQDRVLTVLPLFHVGGLCIQTLPALGAGAEVTLHARFQPDDWFASLRDVRPTLTLLVPATMKALQEHPAWADADLSCLRAVWAGSSLLPAPLVQAFHARGVPVCNVYGSTETGPFSIALPPEHAMDHVGSCGWPAPGVEAKLGERGEVLLRAPNIVERYWPDTPARDADGWFHTGDLAEVDADGSWRIVGRAKELIISGGENIHPAEIEAALAAHPAVLECAAFGLPDAQWGEAVSVAVVLKPDAAADEAALREHLAQRIARYKLPRRWFWPASLPRTALGKVQRQSLARGAATGSL